MQRFGEPTCYHLLVDGMLVNRNWCPVGGLYSKENFKCHTASRSKTFLLRGRDARCPSQADTTKRHWVVKFQFQLNLKNRSYPFLWRSIRSYLHVLYEPFHPVLFWQFRNHPRKIVGAAARTKKNNSWTCRHLHAVIDQCFFSNVTFVCFHLFFVNVLGCFSG